MIYFLCCNLHFLFLRHHYETPMLTYALDPASSTKLNLDDHNMAFSFAELPLVGYLNRTLRGLSEHD